jgi:hypothetical protein
MSATLRTCSSPSVASTKSSPGGRNKCAVDAAYLNELVRCLLSMTPFSPQLIDKPHYPTDRWALYSEERDSALIAHIWLNQTIELFSRLAFLIAHLAIKHHIRRRWVDLQVMPVMHLRKIPDFRIFVYVPQGHIICPRNIFPHSIVILDHNETLIHTLVVIIGVLEQDGIFIVGPVF